MLIDLASSMIKVGLVNIAVLGLLYLLGKYIFGENSNIITFIWIVVTLLITTFGVNAVCNQI